MAEPTYLFKLILLGDVGVGKSCLRERFGAGQFKEMFLQKPWQEVSFTAKNISIDEAYIKLLIWEYDHLIIRNPSIRSHFYRAVHAAFLIFDLTNLDSFVNISQFWINELQNHCDSDVLIALVGNKEDLKH